MCSQIVGNWVVTATYVVTRRPGTRNDVDVVYKSQKIEIAASGHQQGMC